VLAVAARASDAGITAGVHPNSFKGSAFQTAADYEILFDGIDGGPLGYIPDAGHIARGGMDPLATIQKYRSAVCHVHFKDMLADGRWAAMGEGIIDFAGITRYLAATGYDGWLVVEDECARAEKDPDAVTLADGVYMRQMIKPLAEAGATRQ
jgi:inosose dehydratase